MDKQFNLRGSEETLKTMAQYVKDMERLRDEIKANREMIEQIQKSSQNKYDDEEFFVGDESPNMYDDYDHMFDYENNNQDILYHDDYGKIIGDIVGEIEEKKLLSEVKNVPIVTAKQELNIDLSTIMSRPKLFEINSVYTFTSDPYRFRLDCSSLNIFKHELSNTINGFICDMINMIMKNTTIGQDGKIAPFLYISDFPMFNKESDRDVLLMMAAVIKFNFQFYSVGNDIYIVSFCNLIGKGCDDIKQDIIFRRYNTI